MYRDYQSFIQQGRVRVPNPANLVGDERKMLYKWTKEHIDLEYTMDISNKTEKISAPSGRHDDYCDSSAMAIHATLSMLPMEGNFSQSIVSRPINKGHQVAQRHGMGPLLTTGRRNPSLNKRPLRGI